MIDRVQFSTGAAVGDDGAATATGYSPHVAGKVLAVAFTRVHAPPNTTDIVVTDEGDPIEESVIAGANLSADLKVYPRRSVQTNDWIDVTYDGTRKVYDLIPVYGRLKATISQANAGDSITVTVWLEI